MRGVCSLLLAMSLASLFACSNQSTRRGVPVVQRPVVPQPQDVLFKDFPKNWRQHIASTPVLKLPVTPPARGEQTWQPSVISACVFSIDAGGLVPEVNISWNEPIRVTEPRLAAAQAQAQGTPNASGAQLRFDLALQQNAFARNYYSTALSTSKLERFALPSNSPMVNDEAAVLQAGPGLFPKLMDFRAEDLQDRDTRQRFNKYTLVMRDLNQGVSYVFRVSRLQRNEWSDPRQLVVLTPVCSI